MIIASFDIGIKNLAFYIEEYCNETKTSKGICIKLINISSKNKATLDNETRLNLIRTLTEYKEQWDKCDVIVFEQQYFNLRFKGGVNVNALKICEACICWFLDKYETTKRIELSRASNKTKILNAPTHIEKMDHKKGVKILKKMTKPDRKKWATTKAKELLTERGDEFILAELMALKSKKCKLDDVCDCIIQCESWKILNIAHYLTK